MDPVLFDTGESRPPSPGDVSGTAAAGGTPRLRVPQRDQVEMHDEVR